MIVSICMYVHVCVCVCVCMCVCVCVMCFHFFVLTFLCNLEVHTCTYMYMYVCIVCSMLGLSVQVVCVCVCVCDMCFHVWMCLHAEHFTSLCMKYAQTVRKKRTSVSRLHCVHAYFARAESAFWNADSKRQKCFPREEDDFVSMHCALFEAIVEPSEPERRLYSFKRYCDFAFMLCRIAFCSNHDEMGCFMYHLNGKSANKNDSKKKSVSRACTVYASLEKWWLREHVCMCVCVCVCANVLKWTGNALLLFTLYCVIFIFVHKNLFCMYPCRVLSLVSMCGFILSVQQCFAVFENVCVGLKC